MRRPVVPQLPVRRFFLGSGTNGLTHLAAFCHTEIESPKYMPADFRAFFNAAYENKCEPYSSGPCARRLINISTIIGKATA